MGPDAALVGFGSAIVAIPPNVSQTRRVHSAGDCGSSAATIAAIVAIMNTAARYLEARDLTRVNPFFSNESQDFAHSAATLGN